MKKIIIPMAVLTLLIGLCFTPYMQSLLPPGLTHRAGSALKEIQDTRRMSKKDFRSHEISPPTFQPLRHFLLQELDDAEREHDFAKAARLNSFLAAEAFDRAEATLDFWMEQRDPATGLFPGYTYAPARFWDYRNVAADLFPFLIIAAFYLDEAAYAKLLETLERETKLSESFALPQTVLLGSGALVDEGLKEQIFGAAEYIKDGLVPLTEKLGPGPWLERMEGLMQKIWAVAPVKTTYGAIPSNLAEPNGDLLQGLCRLYSATGKESYLAWAERIADVYLLEILPRSGFLPPKEWDFAARDFASNEVWLRDHGNELITGLAELACIECLGDRPRCATYLQPLLTMMDLLLAKGRNSDGLWVNALDRQGVQLKVRKGPLCDNWGYLYAAYLALSQIQERKGIAHPSVATYRQETARALGNIHRYTFFAWERKFEMDGQVDSIESALYLLNRIPVRSAFRWMDEEIGALFLLQNSDGSINRDYLDGNFIRTSLLYGFYKTQGAYMQPWREDMRLGAYHSAGVLYVHLENEQPWQGKLHFDRPRHQLTSSINYPRVNEWPEWFAIEEHASYRVTDAERNTIRTYKGSELINGLAIGLDAHQSITLLVEKAP